jgi:2-methylcitrate dehydratase PrpD
MTQATPFALTRALAQFAASTQAVPAAALQTAAQGVTDAASLIIKARHEPVVQALLSLHGRDVPNGSSLLLGAQRVAPVDAAMVNATAAHAFALDDVAWGCHPSATLFPALLAVGESLDASGAQLLRAWVVGYEVLAELASREPGSLHATGWHPTGLLGPVAAAAAVANLIGLNEEQTLGALSIAASMTGGLSANFGTPVKALHVGQAAAAAVRACLLAQRGVTGSADVLERPRGLLATVSPSGTPDLHSPLGTSNTSLRLLQAGLSLKRYPLCYSLHRVADAAITLADTPGFEADRVEVIDVEIGQRQWQMAPHGQPVDGVQARYSVPFAVASGLVAGAAGFVQLEPVFFNSLALRQMLERVRITGREGASADDPVFAPSDRVRVHMRDGRVLDSGEVAHPRGHARNALDVAERREKFMDCLSGSEVKDPAACHLRMESLPSLSSVRHIAQVFSA